MFENSILYYIFILIGAGIAIYANANEEQNLLVLIIGIVILMFGVFKLQATIPSKKEKESFVESEPIDEEE
ncbi:hypothetical protein [Olleya aquimaris]|uniref:Uncharacterized protein n=1 Tax=Olleya aquimaris TaxID=639310 RepID=A0A327RI89_9FLAO|nr:hypothetical protein [Olleya aquimaris]RAJ16331.1 hypothetical protein LY08_01190 [Olleya aquimaris]